MSEQDERTVAHREYTVAWGELIHRVINTLAWIVLIVLAGIAATLLTGCAGRVQAALDEPAFFYATLFPGEQVEYYTEEGRACTVVFDDAVWRYPQPPYHVISLWCNAPHELIFKTEMLAGSAIPEYDGYPWPRIVYVDWELTVVDSPTKVDRYVLDLPWLGR